MAIDDAEFKELNLTIVFDFRAFLVLAIPSPYEKSNSSYVNRLKLYYLMLSFGSTFSSSSFPNAFQTRLRDQSLRMNNTWLARGSKRFLKR